jgi:hypothetical protein
VDYDHSVLIKQKKEQMVAVVQAYVVASPTPEPQEELLNLSISLPVLQDEEETRGPNGNSLQSDH